MISSIANQRGAIAIFVSIAVLTLTSFAALAVDIGYILATKNELQNIADAAALAAAGKLGDIISDDPYDNSNDCSDESSDCAAIRGAAQAVALNNWAGGKDGITINGSDIEVGTWNWESGDFITEAGSPNAAKTTARMDTSANGPVTTFFAKLFGINSVDVQAMAIAALHVEIISIPGGGGQIENIDSESPPSLVK